MYDAIATTAVSRPKRVLLVSLLITLVLGAFGVGLFDKLKGGGFEDPNSESAQGLAVLAADFDTGPSNIVAIVTSRDGDIDSPAMQAAAAELSELLGQAEGIDQDDLASYWSTGSDALRSEDGARGLILARAVGDEDAIVDALVGIEESLESYELPAAVASLDFAGEGPVFKEIGETIETDLAFAESIAIPITLVLLVIVFSGIRAALVPLVVSILAVFGAFGVLSLLAEVTDVSVYSLNLVAALGLGLAIDYNLFIVSRFREELGNGRSVDDAVRTTVHTAGRTVVFSGLTVAVSLSALLIFPQYFLRSFAYSGIAVILVAMIASIVMVPALLRLLGTRIAPKPANMWRSDDDRIWGRIARLVMRRPIPVAVIVAAGLLFLGAPFLNLQAGVFDDRVLPEDSVARTASDVLRNEFTSPESTAFPVVSLEAVSDDQVSNFAAAVSQHSEVLRVDTIDGRYADGQLIAPPDASLSRFSNGEGVWFNVVPNVEPISAAAEQLVQDIRAVDSGFEFAVSGRSASLVDTKAKIMSLIPVAAAIVASATFVLLFLLFGSLLVPLKAIVLNILSLTATFGLMVWIFQDGNGSGLLNFTPTGLTDTATPILMFCIAFGLSMDYEVFLISRIKEEYDLTGDNELAISRGLARTGKIITAAAILLSVTFFAFATSGVTMIKLFGFGLGVAVLTDAFIVRATLVPALMKLAGSANWWAPAPLAAFHRRFGLHERANSAGMDPAPRLPPPPLIPPPGLDRIHTTQVQAGDRSPAVLQAE